MVWVWTAMAWLSGSLMFSYWLGLLSRRNIREVGDGNPGGVNLLKAAGVGWGLTGIALDFLKGYAPMALLLWNGSVTGYEIVPVAIAPVLGHAFSPFLKFHGGKAIAVTFGVWSALTSFEVSVVYALILAVMLIADRTLRRVRTSLPESDAVQIVLGMLFVFIYLYAMGFSAPYLWCWLGNYAVLLCTHRREISLFLGRVAALRGHH